MAKKEETVKKKVKRETSVSQNNAGVEKVLIENFVSLQHVMTNLAVKFENLSGQISKLLELFEISAKTLAEKGAIGETDSRVVEKLDSLIEQNRVIARGIALIHERRTNERSAAIPNAMQPSAELSKNPRFRNM